MRLDRRLVEEGLAESRTKAQALIDEGAVRVDGETVRKRAFEVGPESRVEVADNPGFVSRAARKLEGLFAAYPVAVAGRRCLDAGASTGGFTQILLKHGAASVTALDVGHDQLHPSLAADSRVENLQGCDIRTYRPDRPFEIVTCDLSFISLRKVLPDLDRLADGVVIVLFKPQFEVGREAARNRQGVVTDERAVQSAMAAFEADAAALGWRLMVRTPSVLPGKEGNREWFYVYRNR